MTQDCADWSCIRNWDTSKRHCHWRILPSVYIHTECQHKDNFLSSMIKSLITVPLFCVQHSKTILNLTLMVLLCHLLSLLVSLWQLVCTSASFNYLLLQLESETLLFCLISHCSSIPLCTPVISPYEMTLRYRDHPPGSVMHWNLSLRCS